MLLGLGTLPVVAKQPVAATAFQPAQLRGFERSILTIERRNGRDSFQIWLAATSAQQQQGLMWIRQLPADYGMLFVLGETRPMNMWMKNTFVSLDMLFVDVAGRITHIVHRATPHSEEIISSGGDVAGVLEIAGGEAQRRGIAVGDRLLHSALRGGY
jgi:uncharacterized membrane protein (UPF0127 family)